MRTRHRLREPVLFHQHVGAALEPGGWRPGGNEAVGSDETECTHAVSLALLAREDDRDADAAVAAARGAEAPRTTPSDAEKKERKRPASSDAADPDNTATRAARVDSFRRVLRERFLDGGDRTPPHARVWTATRLDEAFSAETARRAEEKYFGE